MKSACSSASFGAFSSAERKMPSSTTWSRCCCRAAAGSCAGTSGPCVPLLTATSSRKRAWACSTRSTPTSVPQGQARQPAQPLPRQMRRDGGVWPQVRDGLEQSRDTHVELGRVDNEDDSSGSALPHHLVALASARPFPYPSVTAVSSNSCYYTAVYFCCICCRTARTTPFRRHHFLKTWH